MAVAEGACPSCGAPMTFGVGASISQVCKFCKTVVVRGDRGLEDLGKVADLALTPCPIAIDDECTIEGKRVRILGRVQLDHGEGPWDEWYVGYDNGTWAWLSYAQGNWFLTHEVDLPAKLPAWGSLALEQDVFIGGPFRVVEIKKGKIVSGEGELPLPVRPNQPRYYADLSAAGGGFGTLDYGDPDDLNATRRVSIGRQLAESALVVSKPAGDRPVASIGTDAITCPNCGASIPQNAPDRSAHLACPHCNAVSDIATRTVLERQNAARLSSDIPLGSRGLVGGQDYVVCGSVERSAIIEGERFSWQEYLLYGPGVGFRWVVKDESSWMWVNPVCAADVDISDMPSSVRHEGKRYRLRNHDNAVVDYVVGEFYWRVKVGETVEAHDFISGGDVLSRESPGTEVLYSLSTPISWAALADAFGLPRASPGAHFAPQSSTSSDDGLSVGGINISTTVITVIIIVIFILLFAFGECGSGGGGFFTGGGIRGGK